MKKLIQNCAIWLFDHNTNNPKLTYSDYRPTNVDPNIDLFRPVTIAEISTDLLKSFAMINVDDYDKKLLVEDVDAVYTTLGNELMVVDISVLEQQTIKVAIIGKIPEQLQDQIEVDIVNASYHCKALENVTTGKLTKFNGVSNGVTSLQQVIYDNKLPEDDEAQADFSWKSMDLDNKWFDYLCMPAPFWTYKDQFYIDGKTLDDPKIDFEGRVKKVLENGFDKPFVILLNEYKSLRVMTHYGNVDALTDLIVAKKLNLPSIPVTILFYPGQSMPFTYYHDIPLTNDQLNELMLPEIILSENYLNGIDTTNTK